MVRSLHLRWGALLAALALLGGCGSGDSGKQAQIRVLNVSPGYQSLDLYVNKSGDDSDTLKSSAVGYETLGDYVKMDSDTYIVKFKRNGVSSTLLTLGSEKLTDESHATYVAYGSNGHFAALKVPEDVSDADSNKTKVQVVNTAEAGALDVYLTEDTVSLDDATPQFSALSSGSAASAVSIDSGTYRLRVTGTGDTSDLRLDLSGVSLASKQVITLVLTATQGGVLVNAMLLPQQGSLTVNHNTKARVRGAVGIANGNAVSVNVGGVSILNGQAVGVISAKYSQVDAGTLAVTLAVDGNPVSVANQTLAAGGDYTFLVWSDATGTRTSLITDDNRLPSSSGKAKIRLLNGMSGLGGPITLSVDFSPVAEGIALGAASDYSEVDSGTDSELDVTNAYTAANLLTKTSVSLTASGVYTLFMSGGGTATPAGTLRKDR